MASPQSIQAGTQQAYFMFYDSNGEPSGGSPTALANGTSSGAYPLIGIQEAPSAVPEAEAVTIPGDDTSLGSIIFSSDAARELILNFGRMDLTLEALLQNTLVETFGSISMGLIDPSVLVLATGALIIQGRAVKQSTGQEGLAAYSGWIYPYMQLQPLNRESAQGRTAGVIRYKGVAQLAYNRPWGTTIFDAGGNQIGGYAIPFTASHPLTMDAFRGSLSAITLAKSPSAVATTRPYSDKVYLGVTSINTPTPKTVTPVTPVVAGRPGAVFYEYS